MLGSCAACGSMTLHARCRRYAAAPCPCTGARRGRRPCAAGSSPWRPSSPPACPRWAPARCPPRCGRWPSWATTARWPCCRPRSCGACGAWRGRGCRPCTSGGSRSCCTPRCGCASGHTSTTSRCDGARFAFRRAQSVVLREQWGTPASRGECSFVHALPARLPVQDAADAVSMHSASLTTRALQGITSALWGMRQHRLRIDRRYQRRVAAKRAAAAADAGDQLTSATAAATQQQALPAAAGEQPAADAAGAGAEEGPRKLTWRVRHQRYGRALKALRPWQPVRWAVEAASPPGLSVVVTGSGQRVAAASKRGPARAPGARGAAGGGR